MGKLKRIDYNSYTGYQELDNRLTVATGFRHKTKGTYHKFDGVDLKLYMYMLQRSMYMKHLGKRYFESLDRICVASTGSNYRKNGTNRTRIKKLCDIGLISIETIEIKKDKFVFKDNGSKRVNSLEDVLLYWHLVNDSLVDYDSEQATEQRKLEKVKRIEDEQERVERKRLGEIMGKNYARLTTLYQILSRSPDCDNTLKEIRAVEKANQEKIYYKDHPDFKALFKCNVYVDGVLINGNNEDDSDLIPF